jgi:glycosyltransferase involved in cell wall biosynthesis
MILDCLRSVHNHITDWVICDVGSTDNTKKLIREYYQVNQVICLILHLTILVVRGLGL